MNRFLGFILLLGVVCFNELNAQTIIIKQAVPSNLEDGDDDFGPNRKRFNHSYGGLGFGINGVSMDNESLSPVKGFNSFSLYSGTRYYRNFNKIFASVVDYELSYEQSRLIIDQGDSVQFPVAKADLAKAKYWFVKIGGSLSLQVNFKPKRGNQLGTYLTVGGYGKWLMFKRFGAKYRTSNSNYTNTARLSLGKLKYLNNFDYGPEVKFGKTNFALFAKYRMSDYFKSKESIWNFNELPRLTIGIQFFPGNI